MQLSNRKINKGAKSYLCSSSSDASCSLLLNPLVSTFIQFYPLADVSMLSMDSSVLTIRLKYPFNIIVMNTPNAIFLQAVSHNLLTAFTLWESQRRMSSEASRSVKARKATPNWPMFSMRGESLYMLRVERISLRICFDISQGMILILATSQTS
ncbi:hypothetical protein FGO68_gene1582 [Halteria grandinella]|uniref:Uncharacterized protein n=1 Tax=Halteria grandinella TaxID=5974 RepID=A0A8J8P5B0_HALGN|nr:hypothetical protein FGO68_gene1582 [Halteria grandinella]